MSSITIRQEAEKYAKDQVESQLEQFRHLGIMAGWTEDTTYRTLGTSWTVIGATSHLQVRRSRLRDAPTSRLSEDGRKRAYISTTPTGSLFSILALGSCRGRTRIQGCACIALCLRLVRTRQGVSNESNVERYHRSSPPHATAGMDYHAMDSDG